MRLTPELKRLRDEQAEFQTNTVRSRTLSTYSRDFHMNNKWLNDFIVNLIIYNSKSVYVDLGCGNTIALRQARFLAANLRQDRRLTTYGVDILPADLHKVKIEIERISNLGISKQVLKKKYDPVLIIDNIDSVKFPELADLVTISSALLWTKDPLRAFANAAAQTRVGGVLCANALDVIRATGEKPPLIKNTLPGFEQLTPGNNSVLRKTESFQSADEVLEHWFGKVPKFKRRRWVKRQTSFNHYYMLPNT